MWAAQLKNVTYDWTIGTVYSEKPMNLVVLRSTKTSAGSMKQGPTNVFPIRDRWHSVISE